MSSKIFAPLTTLSDNNRYGVYYPYVFQWLGGSAILCGSVSLHEPWGVSCCHGGEELPGYRGVGGIQGIGRGGAFSCGREGDLSVYANRHSAPVGFHR